MFQSLSALETTVSNNIFDSQIQAFLEAVWFPSSFYSGQYHSIFDMGVLSTVEMKDSKCTGAKELEKME